MISDAGPLFAPSSIGPIHLPNRWVRSATADLGPSRLGHYTSEEIDLYGELAASGLGMIIVGGAEVLPVDVCEQGVLESWQYLPERAHIEGTSDLLVSIRRASPACRTIAQLECNALIACSQPAGPSPVTSPFYEGRFRALRRGEIEAIVNAFAAAIVHAQQEGFDGVQLHAAHGGGLWSFLSPLGNQRTDAYGGSVRRRAHIIAEIVRRARHEVGEFPILIKANCTDNVDGGIDENSFPAMARALEYAGVDAIEVSGGTWDALIRSEEELGFRPVPAAESHTGILSPGRQNYYLPSVKGLDLGIPIILVGGIRNRDAAARIIREGHADFVAMCRPLIREPRLVARWRDGEGPAEASCIACNSCIYSMHLPFKTTERRAVTCLAAHDAALHAEAQQWLATFIDEIRVDGAAAP